VPRCAILVFSGIEHNRNGLALPMKQLARSLQGRVPVRQEEGFAMNRPQARANNAALERHGSTRLASIAVAVCVAACSASRGADSESTESGTAGVLAFSLSVVGRMPGEDLTYRFTGDSDTLERTCQGLCPVAGSSSYSTEPVTGRRVLSSAQKSDLLDALDTLSPTQHMVWSADAFEISLKVELDDGSRVSYQDNMYLTDDTGCADAAAEYACVEFTDLEELRNLMDGFLRSDPAP
jgi:hypothetical protein